MFLEAGEHTSGMAFDKERPQVQRVPSPGGWTPPPGVKPGWEWVPPGGASPRLEAMPAWVKLWYRTPFLDRWAYAWMWEHGGWWVDPPNSPPQTSGRAHGV